MKHLTSMQIRNTIFSVNSQFIPSRAKNLSDSYLNGKMYVYSSIEAVTYDLESFDFDAKLTKNPRSYQLYLQGLTPAGYLLCTYLDSNDIKYLDAADSFIRNWLHYMSTKPNNLQIWVDHSVALRSQVFALYVSILRSQNLSIPDGVLVDMEDSIEIALNEKTYAKNHNHGIMQLKGLLTLAIVLDRDDLLPIVINRLKDQLDYAYTDYGIHVENTFSYQVMVNRLFSTFRTILPMITDSFDLSWLTKKLNESQAFLEVVALAPGKYPQIGDMISTPPIVKEWEPLFKFYDALPGYYIAKQRGTYKILKSGFQSFTHKQFDDLAIYLYSRGRELLIDPGLYNYEPTSMRYYFRSAKAHNTVTVDEVNLQVSDRKLLNRSGFLAYVENERFNLIQGYSDMYSGVHIVRTVHDFGDLMIIRDDCISDTEHTYHQFWHVNEHLTRVPNPKDVVYSLPDSDTILRIRQLNGNVSSVTSRGKNDADPANPKVIWPVSGWVCRKFGEAIPTDTIMFSQNGNIVTFITIISIETASRISLKDGSTATIDDIRIDAASHALHFQGGKLLDMPLPDLSSFSLSFVQITSHNNMVIFENSFMSDQYCYDIRNVETNKPDFVIRYSVDPSYTWIPTADGDYKIKAYVRNGNSRKSALIASAHVEGGEVSIHPY